MAVLIEMVHCRYYEQEDVKDADLMNMYPPGKIIFMRPVKTTKGKLRLGHVHREKLKEWDAVWVTAYELIGEGILLSKAVRSFLAADVCKFPRENFGNENEEGVEKVIGKVY